MAEILIKAVDANHEDPIQDLLCYKRGDIVVVKRDGWPWGKEELKAPKDGGVFVRLKLPGVPVSSVEKYIEQHNIIEGEGSKARSVVKRRRIWRLVVDELPVGVRNQFNTTGEYTTTVAAIRNYIHDKINNVRES